MSGEIEPAKDYYILFCDTEAPAPTLDVYKKRCRQQDVLIADKASYVWGYAGKLTRKQAEAAELRLKLEFWERFRKDWEASGEKFETNFGFYFDFEIADRKPGALDCLAKLSSDLDFLSYVSPHHSFMFYPDRREVQKIEETLKSLPERDHPDFHCVFCVLEFVKTHWSYVKLLSFEELSVGWEYVEYCSSMNLLRHTAASWVIWETLCDEFRIKQKMCDSVSPEVMKTTFETTVRDDKKYIPSLEFPQLVVLAECVDIVNSIRNADGCEDFENTYASRAMDVAIEELAVGSYELEKTLEGIEQTELDITKNELRAMVVKHFARIQGLQLKVEKRMEELKANAERKANREDSIAILAPVLKELQEIKVAVKKNAATSKKGFNSLKPVTHLSPAATPPYPAPPITEIPKSKSKSSQSNNPKEIPNNGESRTIYTEGVEAFLRRLVKTYKDGTLEPEAVEESLRNSNHVSAFLADRPEFKDKKRPTQARSIASALDHGRCEEWTDRHKIWKELSGTPPPRPRRMWDSKPANKKIEDNEDDNDGGKKAGSRSPLPNSRPGFNTVETGRIECNSAVEDYFLELNTSLDSGKIDYTQYRTLFDELTPLIVAEWIKENCPEFKDKGIEPLKNGVEYSDPWRDKRNFRLSNPTSSHKK